MQDKLISWLGSYPIFLLGKWKPKEDLRFPLAQDYLETTARQ